MDLKQLQEEWKEDCKIDQEELGDESARCPILHSKYLNYLVQARFKVKKTENKLLEIKNIKSKYFKGLMTKEELAEREWIQYQGVKPLKGELNEMIECDPDYIEASNYHHYARVTEDFLETVMKELANRNWHIKGCMRWKEWINGG